MSVKYEHIPDESRDKLTIRGVHFSSPKKLTTFFSHRYV